MQESFKSKSHKLARKENKEYHSEADKNNVKNGRCLTQEQPKTLDPVENTREKTCTSSDRWDQLIYIEIQFYIDGNFILTEDVLIKDEFLWEKRNTEYKDVKEFAYNYLFDNLPLNLNKFSFEFLEFCAEYIVSVILKEVEFYKKFDIYKYFETGLFGTGTGIYKEHLLPINLDLKYNEIVLKDSFDYDILCSFNNPEHISHCIITDLKLPKEFFNLISMSIRRQIRDYVFTTLQNFTTFFENFKENSLPKNNKKFVLKMKNSDKNGFSKNLDDLVLDGNQYNNTDKVDSSTKENTEHISSQERLLFENKLESELGPLHKFKHSTRETKFHKPLFLKNRLQNKKKSQSKGLRNKMIIYIDSSRIIISKSILKNEADYDRIVIEKSKIKSFL